MQFKKLNTEYNQYTFTRKINTNDVKGHDIDFNSGKIRVMIRIDKEKSWKSLTKLLKLSAEEEKQKVYKLYKFPKGCKKEVCHYLVEMKETENGYISFHVIFKGTTFIQIGFTDEQKKVLTK